MIATKKFVLKLDLNDVRDKRKALKIVSSLQGIDSIAMDMGEMKLTVIGMADPISIVSKLRKYWTADLISVGPAKEPEEPEEPKKEEEPKTEEAKKEEPKKEEGEEVKKDAEKEEPKKEEEEEEEKKKKKEHIVDIMPYHRPYYHLPPQSFYQYQYQHRSYHPSANTYYYEVQQNAEENQSSCVIS